MTRLANLAATAVAHTVWTAIRTWDWAAGVAERVDARLAGALGGEEE